MTKSDELRNTQEDVDKTIRDAYEAGQIYKVENICNRLNDQSLDYSDQLLAERLKLVRRYASNGVLVDLCCAAGEHLIGMSDISDQCIGIDFSRPFVGKAKERAAELGLTQVRFEVGDARGLPLPSASVATLYSFSSIYAIPGTEAVIKEIGRVLRPGGRCIFDYGNSKSLNAICVKAYTELPPTFHLTISEMEHLCERHGLQIIARRSFQLLPLWADKPRWLWPLLHPAWKRIMAKRIGGKMLDEWVSSNWLLHRFAFRQVLVCEKIVSHTD